jgi:predicted nuclease of predicted toxin-antitoxin system
MRWIVDENVPRSVIRNLRELGHDVISVRESLRSATDIVVLNRAIADQGILVTQDKDFGELVFHTGAPGQYGVVLFRLTGSDLKADNDRMVAVLSGRDDWRGQFAVVTDRQIRLRALPGGETPA